MRWLVRALASLVMLLLMLGIMVVLMPKDGVLDLAAQRFEAATGRKLEIGSGAKVTLWPVLGVSAGPVRLANAPWGSAPDMLVAERIDIGLDPLGLLDGELHITAVELAAPRLLLERDAQGAVNWQMAGGTEEAGAAAGDAASVAFSLGALRLRDGEVRFLDAGQGQDVTLTGIDLATAIPDLAGPVSLTGSALLRGQPLELRADLGHLADALAGRMTDLALSLTSGGNSAAFTGRARLAPLMAEGSATLALTDRPGLAALAGRDLPELPQGFGAESLTLEAGLTYTPERSLHLRGAEIVSDGRSLAAEIDWLPGKSRPRLVARLTTETLALPGSGAAAGSAAGHGAGNGADGWPTETLDLSALRKLDAEVALVAQSVQIGAAHLGPTRARLNLDDARAVLTLTEAEAWGGKLAGLMVVNARKGLSASVDLTLAEADMQAALAEMLGTPHLTGRGSVRVKLLGVGASVDAMMRSLKGEAGLSLTKGEIAGFDLGGMLRTMDPGYVGSGRQTLFDSLSVTAQIEGGVLRSEDLALVAEHFGAGGTGTVDLGARAVDYRLLPRLAQGGVVPVLIKGPWAAPKVRLDLEWLASERAKAEAARAEKLAKERLEALAAEKLGVQRREGETLEDAAKRRAKEAAGAEAGRILDQLLQEN